MCGWPFGCLAVRTFLAAWLAGMTGRLAGRYSTGSGFPPDQGLLVCSGLRLRLWVGPAKLSQGHGAEMSTRGGCPRGGCLVEGCPRGDCPRGSSAEQPWFLAEVIGRQGKSVATEPESLGESFRCMRARRREDTQNGMQGGGQPGSPARQTPKDTAHTET